MKIGNENFVRLLLLKGANANVEEVPFCRSILPVAIWSINRNDGYPIEILTMILTSRANVDYDQYCGKTAVYMAAEFGLSGVLDLLLE